MSNLDDDDWQFSFPVGMANSNKLFQRPSYAVSRITVNVPFRMHAPLLGAWRDLTRARGWVSSEVIRAGIEVAHAEGMPRVSVPTSVHFRPDRVATFSANGATLALLDTIVERESREGRPCTNRGAVVRHVIQALVEGSKGSSSGATCEHGEPDPYFCAQCLGLDRGLS